MYRNDDGRECARCDADAVAGSRFCATHSQRGEVDRGEGVETDGGVDTLDSWDELSYGDEIEYVGPEDLEGEWAVPLDRNQPYTFEYVSVGGTLTCLTRFRGKKYLAPEHTANDPTKWRPADAEADTVAPEADV